MFCVRACPAYAKCAYFLHKRVYLASGFFLVEQNLAKAFRRKQKSCGVNSEVPAAATSSQGTSLAPIHKEPRPNTRPATPARVFLRAQLLPAQLFRARNFSARATFSRA